jgi:hypothetical protein
MPIPTLPETSAATNWGGIGGTLSSQTDLQTALDAKAPLASPALTGNPTAPTQTAGNNSTRLATTAFVQAAISGGVSDGDKGDITVSASGATWAIDNSAVSTAKIADDAVTFAKLANKTYYGVLQSNYTLSNVNTIQKLFNWSTNGALTLPTGIYTFDVLLYIASMSGTNGNGIFTLAGTATLARVFQQILGTDNAAPLGPTSTTGTASVTTASPSSMVTATTGTGLVVRIKGAFDVTATGTVIPSITLATAAAAVVQAGSWFQCQRVGDTATAASSGWS